MHNLQSLKTLTYMMYSIVNNTCFSHSTCGLCDLFRKGSGRCSFYSRIDNNELIEHIFSSRFNLNACCDENCDFCELNLITDQNNTCGFSILSEHIVKISD